MKLAHLAADSDPIARSGRNVALHDATHVGALLDEMGQGFGAHWFGQVDGGMQGLRVRPITP